MRTYRSRSEADNISFDYLHLLPKAVSVFFFSRLNLLLGILCHTVVDKTQQVTVSGSELIGDDSRSTGIIVDPPREMRDLVSQKHAHRILF